MAHELLELGGDAVEIDETMVLRLGGTTTEVSLYEFTLEARPPRDLSDELPVVWREVIAVLDPWPHQGTAVILGQRGFLDTFTVTFGPAGFVLEPSTTFGQRFPALGS